MTKRGLVASLLALALGSAVGARTLDDVLRRYGSAARARIEPSLSRARVPDPPAQLAILVFKRERRLALWARDRRQAWRHVKDYLVLAASGDTGPKLKEGDLQVPEGIYRILWLNPNSRYHLSMKIDYPNAFDRRMAARDGRARLGGDIFIHGKAVSIGCIAIGDRAIEELFTLVADSGPSRVKVIIAPNDLRRHAAICPVGAPYWVTELYQRIGAALAEFPIER